MTPAKEGIAVKTNRKNPITNFFETLIQNPFTREMVVSGDDNWQDLQQAVPCAQLNLGGEVALFPANFAAFVLLQIKCERA